ncbi:MAG: histidine phosphatase family protein [Leptolyngbyaceae cyanobacterium bins.349]|nr:histidine phosphatase family protein [Leptolyngbyaceae cyanobacterium bins.349]
MATYELVSQTMKVICRDLILRFIQLSLGIGLMTSLVACGGQNSESDNSAQTPPSKQTIAASQSPVATESLPPGEKANAEFKDQLAGDSLLTALQQGGHIIYFRHAQTEKDYADQADPNMKLDNCETQRKLSDVGIEQAQAIGAAFTAKNIPVGKVITSEYCRAWKTAELAFGRYEKTAKLNFLPFEDYTDEQVAQMKSNVMPLLLAVPPAGTNTVIIGHDDIFEAATGIYPDPQGIAYVLTPVDNASFKLQANLLPEEWSKL